ncbi:cobalt-factor II C(20)-methyltransferase [Lactobacillus sp. 3B(2020)]|uniref:cobalt-factor II C(20)-methyltransferase n=1 Tax=Lactobacillus sp. 3B(2020) TaxID=2695882 RepID=UPI0015DE9980|nr:cobalt-factor II C(20)-methyltransferase [Lactobacillus sp. 3B(2020)]QLL69179.1 cobalt-factor II C(20)-methyltransferase [Lactobacillus sp. 3B(2020)]
MAKFWGIGVGPGDSELLTVKAVNAIKKLDILYAPQAHKGGPSVAEKIAAPYLSENLEIKRRHFPMVKDWEVKAKAWQAIANEIIADVKAGKEVGFLTLGDTSVYSTYSYIAEMVAVQVEVETIAGIASYTQIAANMSVPLMLDEESLAIVPATTSEERLARIIDDHDNVVIMKIATGLGKVYRILKERRLLTSTTVVTNATMEGQVTKRLSEYSPDAKLPYFTTALLKKKPY